ncbi:MAG: chorismate mutase, partial [Desulfuromonadaceae bacterium]
MVDKDLDGLRQQIDAIDDNILALLNQRAEVVIEVGKTKVDKSKEFYVPSRERAIYERLTANNPGP